MWKALSLSFSCRGYPEMTNEYARLYGIRLFSWESIWCISIENRECTRATSHLECQTETGMQFDEQLKLHFTRQNVKFFRSRDCIHTGFVYIVPHTTNCWLQMYKDACAIAHRTLLSSLFSQTKQNKTKGKKNIPIDRFLESQVRVRMFIILS